MEILLQLVLRCKMAGIAVVYVMKRNNVATGFYFLKVLQ